MLLINVIVNNVLLAYIPATYQSDAASSRSCPAFSSGRPVASLYSTGLRSCPFGGYKSGVLNAQRLASLSSCLRHVFTRHFKDDFVTRPSLKCPQRHAINKLRMISTTEDWESTSICISASVNSEFMAGLGFLAWVSSPPQPHFFQRVLTSPATCRDFGWYFVFLQFTH